jgi:hypothetical protein
MEYCYPPEFEWSTLNLSVSRFERDISHIHPYHRRRCILTKRQKEIKKEKGAEDRTRQE